MSIVLLLSSMTLFAVLHSILARQSIKSRVRAAIGERAYEGLYRIGYNIFASISFAPVLVILFLSPGPVVWNLNGIMAVLFRLLQLTGLIGLTVSLLQIDGWRFLGVKQLLAYLNGDPLPLPPEPLKTGGVYALVRHPLYLFSLLVLWFTPSMQLNWLVFVAAATVYFVVGSLFEERTMHQIFGDTYETYRQQTPWMIPFVK